MPRLADRISQSSPKNYGMYAKSAQLADQSSLIHLELGQPFHDTPAHIKAATIEAITAGHVHYSDLAGIAPLRSALADKLRTKNSIAATPDEIIVTNGLTHASFVAFMAVIDPGDEVILLDPSYPQHVGKIELVGGKVVPAPLDATNGFSIRAEWIEARVTARTKAIVLVNPGNPTGRVYSRTEMEALAGVASRNNLLVISDEVYEFNIYEGQHVSIASLPDMAHRTISMFAFTKGYAMDGWRLGYVTAAPDLTKAMLKVTANDVTHVNTFVQYGGLAAVRGPADVVDFMVSDDRSKRDLVVDELNQMSGVTCASPAGGTYAFADIRRTGLSSQVVADRLLTEAGVVVEAGSFYGNAGEGFLRICFGSQPTDRLKEAMGRMRRFFDGLCSS